MIRPSLFKIEIASGGTMSTGVGPRTTWNANRRLEMQPLVNRTLALVRVSTVACAISLWEPFVALSSAAGGIGPNAPVEPPVPVPEPSMLLLAAAGVAAAGIRRYVHSTRKR
jgi:hypothetical protein